jgi:hypothetical protein
MSLALPSATTTGNFLVLAVVSSGSDTLTVTSSAPDSWSLAQQSPFDSNCYAWIYYAPVSFGTTDTVSIFPSGSAGLNACLMEFTGGLTAPDTSNSASGNSTTPSVGVLGGTPPELQVAVLGFTEDSCTITPPSGWTDQYNDGTINSATPAIDVSWLITSTSFNTASWGLTTGQDWTAATSCFMCGMGMMMTTPVIPQLEKLRARQKAIGKHMPCNCGKKETHKTI